MGNALRSEKMKRATSEGDKVIDDTNSSKKICTRYLYLTIRFHHSRTCFNREKKPYRLFVNDQVLVKVGKGTLEDVEVDETPLLELIKQDFEQLKLLAKEEGKKKNKEVTDEKVLYVFNGTFLYYLHLF